ncbi:MAG: 2-dehydropantoate 2-reductase [Psychromonas sp.]
MWQIIGAGAIGCLWAANLLRTGHKIQLISRKNSTLKTLYYQDLQGKKVIYDCPHSIKITDSSSPILVCVKAPQVKDALLQQRKYIGSQQVIILMHNGMGCAEQVAKLFPNNPIICATTANACLLTGPLNIQQTGLGITYLGPFNELAKPFSHLASTLNKAVANCHWRVDIKQKLWLKLMINIAINPLTAIFKVKNGELAKPSFQMHIKSVVAEAMPLLNKLNLGFNQTELITIINNVIIATATNHSSMNRDIHFQRTTENDYISGYLLKKASQYKIVTPLISSLHEQIKALENHSLTQLNND